MIAGVKEGGYTALNAALSVPGQVPYGGDLTAAVLLQMKTFDPELDKQLDNAFGILFFAH